MSKTRITVNDVLQWYATQEEAIQEKSEKVWQYYNERQPVPPGSPVGAYFNRTVKDKHCDVPLDDLHSYSELDEMQMQIRFDMKGIEGREDEETEFHKKIRKAYCRTDSVFRNTELYIKIKAFYDAVWDVAKYDFLNLDDHPKVKEALETLADFVLNPPIVNGWPIHLLPIPNELYRWTPDNIPERWSISRDDRIAYLNAARLQKLCDPLRAVKISKQIGKGTPQGLADKYFSCLLEKVGIFPTKTH